jgi:hypothetical protein
MECQNQLVARKEHNDVKPDDIVIQKKVALQNEVNDIKSAVVMDPTEEIKNSFEEIQKNTVSALTREMKFERLVE